MKTRTRIILCAIALTLTLIIGVFAAAAANETDYQGSDLPVSESYVIRVLRDLEARLNGKIDTVANDLAKYKEENKTAAPAESKPAETTPAAPAEAPAVSMDYEVLCLKKGQTLTGSCELILRSGKAEAVCPGANGIADLTVGTDIADKAEISLNHLLLIPRDDGRGLTVLSGEAYVMVRGTYHIAD
ncbi:MAG: hypothetical protein MJ175_07640 [Clostridia bacterium]|nr:hypothetical protein [Clostridia bacterium]